MLCGGWRSKRFPGGGGRLYDAGRTSGGAPGTEREPMTTEKYRLVTRSDFDGLVCAVLLKKLDLIDEIKFVHPKDMQDGKVPVTARDITTNLPYVEGVTLAFDHHTSETLRVGRRTTTSSTHRRPPRRAWCTATTVARSASRRSPTT